MDIPLNILCGYSLEYFVDIPLLSTILWFVYHSFHGGKSHILEKKGNIFDQIILKAHSPIFQNLVFLFFEESSLQICNFKFSVETVQPFGRTKQFCILQLPYIILCKLDNGYHKHSHFH